MLRIVTRHADVIVALKGAELAMGRGGHNDVRIDADVVSATHARLVREDTTYRYVHLSKTNPTLLHGMPIADVRLHDGDRLEIGPGTSEAVTIVFQLGGAADNLDLTRSFKIRERPHGTGIERLSLPTSGVVTIGRAADNDLVLSSLAVSRRHARLEVSGGLARLIDTESANGTYVNGVAAGNEVLRIGDIVRIGPYKLVLRDGAIEHHDDSRAVRLDVHAVTKLVSGRTLLSGISFSARPGQVLVIAGTSGAGKSTLIDALNGLRPPTSGHVLVNGADLYRAYDALRPLIGYVPQEPILPTQLSVRRALHYVARLRLPPDVSAAEADQRVDEVIRELDLVDRQHARIANLSGGQQKRASIAAELIARPGLFFLDEPTSGLDPGLTRRVTGIIRDLASAGSTAVVVSHDVESLQAADQIVFLAGVGRVVFVGGPEEALAYFGVDDLAAIYEKVEAGDPEDCEQAWRNSKNYVNEGVPPRDGAEEIPTPAPITWDPFALIGASVRRGSSAWQQFWISTSRYIESMLGDRTYLALLLLQAPIIAVLLTLVAKPADLQPPPAAAVAQATAFGIPAAKLASTLTLILAASAIWFGAINAAKEIVKELPMLRRERLAGLRVAPYLASKFVVLAALCLLQTAALLGIIWVKVGLPSSGAFMWGPLELWITLNLAAIAALGLGLVISAWMNNADRATSLVPILVIPQLIFVGGPGIGAAGRWLSYLMISHWSVEAMKVTAGIPYNSSGTGFGVADLLLRWGVLAGMTAVFMSVAAWRLASKNTV
jgi:ABC-type multidrug transport system ATPase subunit/ABC-type multidrug transport system permease subunit